MTYDIATVAVAIIGYAFLLGGVRQRVVDVELKVSHIEKMYERNSALLTDIRERVIKIETCLMCDVKPSQLDNAALGK